MTEDRLAHDKSNEPRLTQRELEVLMLIRRGDTTKDIARAIGRSVKTAEFHVRNVLWKHNARSRGELLRRPVPPK